MMPKCKCGSYAINLHRHGRDGTDPESCDVCFWRNKAPKVDVDALMTLAEEFALMHGRLMVSAIPETESAFRKRTAAKAKLRSALERSWTRN